MFKKIKSMEQKAGQYSKKNFNLKCIHENQKTEKKNNQLKINPRK